MIATSYPATLGQSVLTTNTYTPKRESSSAGLDQTVVDCSPSMSNGTTGTHFTSRVAGLLNWKAMPIVIPFFLLWFACLFPASASADDIPDIHPAIYLCKGDSADNFGSLIARAGDQNGDNFADFWVAQPFNRSDSGGEKIGRVYLYHGGNPMDTIPDFVFDDSYLGVYDVGDVNLDGYRDIVLSHYDITRGYDLHFGGDSLSTTPNLVFPRRNSQSVPGWSNNIAIGGIDIDGDSNPDLVITETGDDLLFAGEINIYSAGPELDNEPEWVLRTDNDHGYRNFGFSLAHIPRFGADGSSYLAVTRISSESWAQDGTVQLYKLGPDFDTLPDMELAPIPPNWGWYYGWHINYAGDVNNDGYGDLATGTGRNYYDIFFGGPSVDTIPDVSVVPLWYECIHVGDINSDGISDLLGGDPELGISRLYYGGDEFDQFAEARPIASTPGEASAIRFGGGLSGYIGDINGDGLDDFAVSGWRRDWDNPTWPGFVNVFYGFDSIPTSVEISHENTLPEGFALRQNYPNPFNSGTVIEFDLHHRVHTQLTIVNVSGQTVCKLLNEELPVGTYHVRWPGTDSSGTPVSSGVYFCQLVAGGTKQSIKMTLIK